MVHTKKRKILVIRREWCKGCNICVAFCPQEALALDGEEKIFLVRPEACNACGLCELRCPDFALELVSAPGNGQEASS